MESMLFSKSLLLGLAVAAPLGPIGALCINRTLDRGFAAGVAGELGTAVADGVYASLAAFGFAAFSDALAVIDTPLRLIGGAFLLWLGWRSMTPQPPQSAANVSTRDLLGTTAATFLLTSSIHVGQRLQAETRASDLLARWGGDEFVMLLSDLTRDRYLSTVERFRASLVGPFGRSLDRPVGCEEQPPVVSASFGAAFFPEDGGTLSELLSQADEAMYSDKAARRRVRARRAHAADRVRPGPASEGRPRASWGRLRVKGV